MASGAHKKTTPKSKRALEKEIVESERRQALKLALDSTDFPHDEVKRIISDALHKYRGNLDTFQSAIGCLLLCVYLGRRVMQVVHDPKTIQKYESILGVKFKELSFIPETTLNSERSFGFKLASAASNFWKYIRSAKPARNNEWDVPPTPSAPDHLE